MYTGDQKNDSCVFESSAIKAYNYINNFGITGKLEISSKNPCVFIALNSRHFVAMDLNV